MRGDEGAERGVARGIVEREVDLGGDVEGQLAGEAHATREQLHPPLVFDLAVLLRDQEHRALADGELVEHRAAGGLAEAEVRREPALVGLRVADHEGDALGRDPVLQVELGRRELGRQQGRERAHREEGLGRRRECARRQALEPGARLLEDGPGVVLRVEGARDEGRRVLDRLAEDGVFADDPHVGRHVGQDGRALEQEAEVRRTADGLEQARAPEFLLQRHDVDRGVGARAHVEHRAEQRPVRLGVEVGRSELGRDRRQGTRALEEDGPEDRVLRIEVEWR